MGVDIHQVADSKAIHYSKSSVSHLIFRYIPFKSSQSLSVASSMLSSLVECRNLDAL